MANKEIEEKLSVLLKDPDFCSALGATESSAEIIKILSGYGIEITEEELNEILSSVPLGKNDELEESVLEEVSGGGIISSLWARFRAALSGGGGGHRF